MTLKKWMEKYYPVPADKVKKKDALAAVELKWSGLTLATLKKYGLERSAKAVYDDNDKIFIDDNTCALCALYMDKEDFSCSKCPLFKERGAACDQPFDNSPYSAFTMGGDPRPMLRLIRKAKKAQK